MERHLCAAYLGDGAAFMRRVFRGWSGIHAPRI
jgi:hypothetical protein